MHTEQQLLMSDKEVKRHPKATLTMVQMEGRREGVGGRERRERKGGREERREGSREGSKERSRKGGRESSCIIHQ